MKISRVLLASAASLLASHALAADLPAKKSAPVASAANGCPAFGAGFFQIPGSETCLRVGGYVRSNNKATLSAVARGTAPYTLSYDYALQFDARNNTEIGSVRSFIEYDTSSTPGTPTDTYVYVQAAGFTMGKADSLAAIGIQGINKPYWAGQDTGIYYTAALATGTSISFGAVTAQTTYNSATTAGVTSGRPDIIGRLDAKAGPADLNLVAASHEAAGATSGAYNAYALLGRGTVAMGDATVALYGAYANGVSAYLTNAASTGIVDTSTDSSTGSSGTNLGASVKYKVGQGTFQVFGSQVNINGSSSSDSFTGNYMGVNYQYDLFKDLYIRPEIYSYTTNKDAAGPEAAMTGYLRIQRSF